MNKLETQKNNKCPICGNILTNTGLTYGVKELFSLWSEVRFRDETIIQHRMQSELTTLYECSFCKLGIYLPQIIGTSDFYEDLQKCSSDSYYVCDKWDFNEALNDINKDDVIVEIGCGPGVFLEKATNYTVNAVGTEYNDKAISLAKSKGLNVFKIDDEEPLKDRGKFDIAYSFHVLEHVPDPVAFLQEMLAWVKPGGKIGISVPNMDGPVKYINPCVSNMPPHHATRWKLDTFKVLAETLGLKIERVAYEPLIVRDHYYYSHFLVNHWFPVKYMPNFLLQNIFSRMFNLFFSVLAVFNINKIGLLKGQSIYLLFSKQEDR